MKFYDDEGAIQVRKVTTALASYKADIAIGLLFYMS